MKRLVAKNRPIRMWIVSGEPDTGKTDFLAAMENPCMIVDADGRADELPIRHPKLTWYSLCDEPADATNPLAIAKDLEKYMPGSDAKLIAVDSMTPIIAPLVADAMLAKQQAELKGSKFNMSAAMSGKALATRRIQDAVSKWGKPFVLVYHVYDANDQNAQKVRRTSLPKTEVGRLVRSINMRIELFKDKGRYGARIDWTRNKRGINKIVWDEKGHWQGVPEKLEDIVYGNLTPEQLQQLEAAIPTDFVDEPTAWAWGVERGVFDGSIEHARNAFQLLMRQAEPETDQEKWDLWISDVERRVVEQKEAGKGPMALGKPVQRPADFPGIQRLLKEWEAAHANDKALDDKALDRYRGLVVGKLDQFLGHVEDRHILTEALYHTEHGSSKNLTQAQLSALWTWMACEKRKEQNESSEWVNIYLGTPDTEIFKTEARPIIDAFRVAHGQIEVPFDR